MSTVVYLLEFSTGSEQNFPCSNGQVSPYNNNGYTFLHRYNYYDAGIKVFGAGHYEIATLGATGTMCDKIDDYNTALWSSAGTAEGASTFFYSLLRRTVPLEHGEIKNNTIVTNLVGGKQYPEIFDFYTWTTSNSNPNLINISWPGASCPVAAAAGTGPGWSCTNPAEGPGLCWNGCSRAPAKPS